MSMYCESCYWEEAGKCEVYGLPQEYRFCVDYLNDTNHSKRVKEALKYNPEWCVNHWNLLDTVDRKRYIEFYGKPEF